MLKSQRNSFFIITLPLLVIFWVGVFTLNLKLIVGVGVGYALIRIVIWNLMSWFLNHPTTIKNHPEFIRRMKARDDLLIKNGELTILAWLVNVFWVVAAPFDFWYSYYLYKKNRID